MKNKLSQPHAIAVALFAAAVLFAAPARAQFNGSHSPGDFGVASGSQPKDGFYLVPLYFHYSADTLKGPNGKVIAPGLIPGTAKGLRASGPAMVVWYVSKAKFFGANYGALSILAFPNSTVQAPVLGIDKTVGIAIGDTYFCPIDLGWHEKRADFRADFGFYAPTGPYTAGGSQNTGNGMWTYEPMVGTTAYVDQKKTVSLATNAYWDIPANKKSGTDIKVGQVLLLEGGGGKSFVHGAVVLGAAYYALWKITPDDIGAPMYLPALGRTVGPKLDGLKDRVYALGPDITLPIASKSTLFALMNFRYQWEMGARTKTQGENFSVVFTFPVPSVKLPHR